ncbi:MAG: hypothetical protein NTV33_11680 [Coprothermobacterota bacterium]|nr:hypothetical protein [Coprothermobacterota bacterium]
MIEQLAKKEWTEPELIVLVRNKPEEAVLRGCKGGEPADSKSCDGGCFQLNLDYRCEPCDDYFPS